jgi:hypothetical protein
MMTRIRLIVLVVLFVVVASAIAAVTLLPRRYWAADQPSGIAVFWRDDEAFVFIDHHAMARSTNAALERLPQSGWWGMLAAAYGDWRALGHSTSAYRLGGGGIERYELPNTVLAPAWDLADGRLVARSRVPSDTAQGYGWTGTGFTRRPPEAVAPSPRASAAASPDAGARTLEADDEEEDTDLGSRGPISAEARERLQKAGWHYKHLSGYEGIRQPAALPIPLPSGRVTLSLRSRKLADSFFPYGTTVELSGDRLSPPTQILFDSGGWKEISRPEFEARSAASGSPAPRSSFRISALVLLLLWLGLLILKVGGVAGGFLSFLGLKGRLVKGVATTMSFPPAIPEQFPGLDRPRLDALSRDLEDLGFERLLDTAPIANSPTHPPSFCRIYAHRRHACFGVLLQVFPGSGGPIELRCMLNGYLDEGWSVGVSNGQPMAASALVRRPRAIGILFPTATPAELLSRFLAFRDRVCMELGLRPIADTSLATYIQRTLESLGEISAAMKKKNMAVGLGQFYSRKLGLASKESQRVWLGDYPTLAEKRREAGMGPGFGGASLFEESP